MRYLFALVAGLFVTLGLFYFMSTLISTGKQQAAPQDSGSIVEFVRVKDEENVQTRERSLPKKPPPPESMPSKPQLSVASQDKPQAENLNIETPMLAQGLQGGMGPYLGTGGKGGPAGDAEEMPIVRIQPQYPQKAQIRGIEGFVTLSFVITKEGSTRDVRVVEANPPRVFDQEAKRAVLKWRYKPKFVNGEAVERETLITLEFNLANQ